MKELRRFLGSLTRPLSFADLVELLNARDGRRRSSSTVQRWEKEGVEPDYASARLMATLAGVTFEEFTLGSAPKGKDALAQAMAASAGAPRGAQLEPKDVPAPDPRKATAKKPEEKKRAG